MYYLHGVYIVAVIVTVPNVFLFEAMDFSVYLGAALSIMCLLCCLFILAFVDESRICSTKETPENTETTVLCEKGEAYGLLGGRALG